MDMPTPNEVAVIKELPVRILQQKQTPRRCTSYIYLEQSSLGPTLLWSLLESLAVELPDAQDKIVEFLAAITKPPNPVSDGNEPTLRYNIRGSNDFPLPKQSPTRVFFLPAAADQIIFASYPLWNL
ncbi:MAG: hypothetical protein Q9169_007870 [Polycauliona sp. 2 TL-2023]